MALSTAANQTAEERISVASNWTLVWWRFRKHRLAMISSVILLILYAVVLCPDFFSTQDPELTEARQAFIPVQGIHLFDGATDRPLGPGDRRQAQSGNTADGMARRPVAKGSYRLFRAGQALQDSWADPRQSASGRRARFKASEFSCWAPTGSGAISGRASCTARKHP